MRGMFMNLRGFKFLGVGVDDMVGDGISLGELDPRADSKENGEKDPETVHEQKVKPKVVAMRMGVLEPFKVIGEYIQRISVQMDERKGKLCEVAETRTIDNAVHGEERHNRVEKYCYCLDGHNEIALNEKMDKRTYGKPADSELVNTPDTTLVVRILAGVAVGQEHGYCDYGGDHEAQGNTGAATPVPG
ncbi:hypothetical protein AYI68_g2070 [Smittium mucronatum]|uniref:Uncharacterized protein n=1 Tax=Smittium mucronatum TaxID=133383 RepID=A0A1R0H3R3_9FUNG|nr:hypothetical protein AYI68_g2070 [Smittium mucronatum]